MLGTPRGVVILMIAVPVVLVVGTYLAGTTLG